MTMRRLCLSAIIALSTAHRAAAQPDQSFNHDFDRADRRARDIVAQLRCAQRMAGLRARGAFGAADTLGATGQCIRVGDGYIGVFLGLDSAGLRHERFSAVDLTRTVPNTARLDTASLVAAARARREALGLGAASMGRPFAPFILRGDADTVEVWLMPMSVFTGAPLSSGGERGYIYAAHGARLLTTIDAAASFDTLSTQAGAPIDIRRTGDRLPLLSDIVLANLLARDGREVNIQLASVTSRLINTPGGGIWLHTKRAAR